MAPESHRLIPLVATWIKTQDGTARTVEATTTKLTFTPSPERWPARLAEPLPPWRARIPAILPRKRTYQEYALRGWSVENRNSRATSDTTADHKDAGKDQLCRHYGRGRCWYGLECKFSHGTGAPEYQKLEWAEPTLGLEIHQNKASKGCHVPSQPCAEHCAIRFGSDLGGLINKHNNYLHGDTTEWYTKADSETPGAMAAFKQILLWVGAPKVFIISKVGDAMREKTEI